MGAQAYELKRSESTAMLPHIESRIVESDAVRLERSIRRAARRLGAIAEELEGVDHEQLTSDSWLLVRARMGNLIADFNDGVGDIDRVLGTSSAQRRILRYLQLRLGEVVTKEELSGVAGIYEWARRVRELRIDHGWAIHSAITRDDLRPGEYILSSATPDEHLARDWMTARRVRKLRSVGGEPSGKTRLLEYLKAIHPRAADKEQLAYVAGSARDSHRFTLELINDGWRVFSSLEDPSLDPGQRRLGSLDRAAPSL